MNSTEDMVHHRGHGAPQVMFVCECMRHGAPQVMFVCGACDMVRHSRNYVCVVAHAVWGDVSRVKGPASALH